MATMANNQYNPTSSMNNMMMTNHIMNHFNNLQHKNISVYETLTDSSFLSQTMIMFLQIFAISIFTGLTTYMSSTLGYILKFINKTFHTYIIGYLFYPIIFICNFIYKLIFKKKIKYTISRNISLITSEYKRNGELLEIIQWFISSDYCKKKSKNIIQNTTKEIYYHNSIDNSLRTYNSKNLDDKINFSITPVINSDFVILYDNHEIICTRDKHQIEINGDLETQKRDNITYYLETIDENQESDIIERFCDHAVRIYNSNRIEWKQKLFTSDGNQWDMGKDVFSPNSVDSVILRSNIKDEFINSLDFFFKNKDFYKNHGQRYKYVTVLMGPPGTGKTTLVMAYANQNKRNIYSLNLNEIKQGDLKYLIDSMDCNEGDLLIDDFDHYYSSLGNDDNKDKDKESDKESKDSNSRDNNNDDDDDDDDDNIFRRRNKRNNKSSSNKHKPVSYHELLTVLDGTGSKEGLNIYICINDPSKIFKSTNIEDLALFRDRRVNKIIEFKYCDHDMIAGIYKNIFHKDPNMTLIKMIREDYYAPCVIAQQFITLYEKYGGKIDDKQSEIENILVNLANNKIETNQDKIISYINTLKEYNKEKTL